MLYFTHIFPQIWQNVILDILQESNGDLNGLYIVNAQYWHTGQYECVAQTVFSKASVSASLLITGRKRIQKSKNVQHNSYNESNCIKQNKTKFKLAIWGSEIILGRSRCI